jgi:hypothetical protein
MKVKKLLVVGMLMTVMLLAFAGCGGSDSGDSAAADSAVESTAPAEAETVEQAATEQIAEAANTQTKAEDLVGSWVDVNAADRFVNIAADGAAYSYEDNEGKLAATFEEGVLKISVSDTDKADAYIDAATGHLMVVYQDNISEYAKK